MRQRSHRESGVLFGSSMPQERQFLASFITKLFMPEIGASLSRIPEQIANFFVNLYR